MFVSIAAKYINSPTLRTYHETQKCSKTKENSNKKITTQERAKQVFDSLVQNNIKDAENFSLEGGKVKIVARKRDGFDSDNDKTLDVRVDIKEANIGANEIDISATAEVDRQQRVDLAKATVNVAPDAMISTGNQSITINNQTKKPLIVGDIKYTSVDGKYTVAGGAIKKTNAGTHEVVRPKIDINSNGKVSINGELINGIDGKTGKAIENGKLSVTAKNGVKVAKHQTYDSITAVGLVDIANVENGTLDIYGNITNKKGNTQLYGSDGISLYGRIHSIDGDVIMTANKGDLRLAKESQVHVEKGNLNLSQQDVRGNLDVRGQVIIRNGDLTSESFGNKTNNGLIFIGEFMNENDLEDLIPLYRNGPEINDDVSENMDVGWDVSKDQGLEANEIILRMNRRGAVIVNEDNLKVGDKVDVRIKFEGVNVTVECKVIKIEGNLAQVKFKDLPTDVANKITYRYMKLANS